LHFIYNKNQIVISLVPAPPPVKGGGEGPSLAPRRGQVPAQPPYRVKKILHPKGCKHFFRGLV